jgi:hypothetical protein
MRKLMYYVHQQLDGFIGSPSGEFDWAELGPDLGCVLDGSCSTRTTWSHTRWSSAAVRLPTSRPQRARSS